MTTTNLDRDGSFLAKKARLYLEVLDRTPLDDIALPLSQPRFVGRVYNFLCLLELPGRDSELIMRFAPCIAEITARTHNQNLNDVDFATIILGALMKTVYYGDYTAEEAKSTDQLGSLSPWELDDTTDPDGHLRTAVFQRACGDPKYFFDVIVRKPEISRENA